MKSTCHNFTQIYDNTTGTNTCTGQSDTSMVVQNNLKNLQSTFTVIDGTVADPFMGSNSQYILVKDAAENNWLWVNP